MRLRIKVWCGKQYVVTLVFMGASCKFDKVWCGLNANRRAKISREIASKRTESNDELFCTDKWKDSKNDRTKFSTTILFSA